MIPSALTQLTAEEAAELIADGETIGFSGFTPAGAAKAIPRALAKKAIAEHEAGRPFKVGVVTGASTGDSLDGELARAEAILFRTPYQSNRSLRESINTGKTRFFDMHLSMLAQYVRAGFLGPMHWAIVEASSVSADGEIVLTTSVGGSPTFLTQAKRILIELNTFHPPELRGFHDIYEAGNPPDRKAIPICRVMDRAGKEVVKVDPRKIEGIVLNNEPDETPKFTPSDPITDQIGVHVANFLAAEKDRGHIPKPFLPIQSGVGNIANAVLAAMGRHPGIPPFELYSEVIQDSALDLLHEGRILSASGTSLTLSSDVLKLFFDNIESFRSRLILRPQEITNHPEVVRRMGIISVNTALELDIFGNVNSTHVLGKTLMNGIGGSGDFTRNAHISIFVCPSLAKQGKITPIVPLCSHMDHSEHSVQVVVTEQGVADLRGKDPMQRARLIIENCAHPKFKPILREYLGEVVDGHTPQTLRNAFALHESFLRHGDMEKAELV